MLSILEFGGWIFWTIILLTLFFGIVSIEQEEETTLGWPLVIVVVAGLILGITYRAHIKANLSGIDYGALAAGAGIYLVVGIAWSFFKWYKYVGKKYREYRKRVEETRKNNFNVDKNNYIPEVAENKEQISAWIFFWPFSMLRWAIGNALVDFLNAIVRLFKGWYDAITKSQFKDEI